MIIAYFTESSLNSGMVAKEVDAAQIQHLKDSGISFLPYVRESITRGKLRLDIQTLHCRVWNDENYHEILPSVVAEIWRSYMERNIANSVLHERNRRLELEIELNELKADSGGSGFTPHEEKEFRYIYEKLDEPKEISIRVSSDVTSTKLAGKFSFLKLLLSSINSGRSTFDKSAFEDFLCGELKKAYPHGGCLAVEIKKTLTVDLFTYGFIESIDLRDQYYFTVEQFTSKLYRFRFWLEVNGLSGDTPAFDIAAEAA